MKFKIITCILALLLITFCGTSQEPVFSKMSKTYDNPEYGTLVIRRLKNDALIDTYPVKKGKVTFYANGKLCSFVLADEHKMNGARIPGGSLVEMYNTGYPEFIYLTDDIELNGFKIPKKQGIVHWHCSFYNDGSLSMFRTVDNVEIDGIPCSKGKALQLYPNGQLWHCYLSQDYNNGKETIPSGTQVILDLDKNVSRYSLPLFIKLKESEGINKYLARY